ncbi:MAG: protein kinase [Phycisphaerales bacterium]|nr:protein kinase [Phycisphaerales bacterium]
MSSPDRDRASEAVDLLLTMPEDRRAAAARLMCGEDAALLALVTKALSEAGQDDLLKRIRDEQSTADVSADADGSARTQALSNPNRLGSTIGVYKLLERLGEGGFGEVYAAEQSEPIRRRVAVKIIKPGMDSRAVVARFEAERQALALMDHPNIAKVLDAGTTRAGRPYFVMELVRGVPITTYCEENRLSPRERIELMIPVCQAIQHAHQKGIIHRDIKPGNVLVTITDGKAVPKVIDFGIAKAIAGASTLTDKTIYTAFRQFIGTPAYMSPEQILQSGVDVDTRSDVYALGVMMYELLSGSLPFDTESLLKEGLERMQQVVREQDPPKPSTRVLTMDAGKRTSVAAARRLQPDKLGGSLRGEVDWMVMKAVEKDRNRRYQSPTEFAEDLRRYLDGDAVKASPPSGWYRARKFVRRHRVAVALAGVAVVGLLATVVGTNIGLRREAAQRAVAVENERIAKQNEARANDETSKAQKSAERAQAAMNFLPSVLIGADPTRNEGRKDVTVGEMLDRAVAAADKGTTLSGQPLDPDVEATARLSVAVAYYGIGRYAEGLAQARRSLAIAERVYGAESPEILECLGWVGTGLWYTGGGVELEAMSRRQLAIIEKSGLRNTTDHAQALNLLSLSLHGRGMNAEALAVDIERLGVSEKIVPPNRFQIASSLHEIALNMNGLGRAAEALPYITRSVAEYEKLNQEIDVSRPLTTLGVTLTELGRLEEAEASCRRSMEISDRLRGKDHPYPKYERNMLARVLIKRGKFAEAQEILDTADKLAGQRGPNGITQAAWLRAMLLRAQGQPEQASKIYEMMRAGKSLDELVKDVRGVIGIAADGWGTTNDLGRYEQVAAEGEVLLPKAREALGTDPDNTLLRPFAAEMLRAYLALGDVASLAKAEALRAQYPGLKPGPGRVPAQP